MEEKHTRIGKSILIFISKILYKVEKKPIWKRIFLDIYFKFNSLQRSVIFDKTNFEYTKKLWAQILIYKFYGQCIITLMKFWLFSH